MTTSPKDAKEPKPANDQKTAGAPKIRVVVVDDHEIVRNGLAWTIEDEPDMEVVGQAATAAEALALYRARRPDVTLVDLVLPDKDGIELIAELRAEAPDARCIVLTTLDGDDHIFRAIEAGALAYILKDMACGEITDAVRLVHRGERMLPPPVADKLAARGPALSRREIQILELIATGESNKIIAAKLGLVEGTVKMYILNLFKKLGVDDRTGAVTTALRRGIIKL